MSEKKRLQIQQQREAVENRLLNAERYVERNVNVEGTSFLHFDDWKGNSGHPLWMKNHMIPSTMEHRRKKEKALEALDKKSKDQGLSRRRRHRASEAIR